MRTAYQFKMNSIAPLDRRHKPRSPRLATDQIDWTNKRHLSGTVNASLTSSAIANRFCHCQDNAVLRHYKPLGKRLSFMANSYHFCESSCLSGQRWLTFGLIRSYVKCLLRVKIHVYIYGLFFFQYRSFIAVFTLN